jgi:hypothetical protein
MQQLQKLLCHWLYVGLSKYFAAGTCTLNVTSNLLGVGLVPVALWQQKCM